MLELATIADEVAAGYSRDDWNHWIDQDGDGLDTRQEVLAAESLQTPEISENRVRDGQWASFYDGRQTSSASDFDVDHVVPLNEAHQSGGWAWDALTRQLYANDLTFPDHLIAVSASSNRSKGARDPAEWLPSNPEALCTYLAWWTAIKVRWELSMDPAEHQTISRYADNQCAGTRIDLAAADAGTVQITVAAQTPPTDAQTPSDGSDCHPAYDPCLPIVDDLNCSDVKELGQAPVTIINIGQDPYRLDGNRDGVACT
ncbi:GmrSD restriction endonuclease domain-containing protein [Candidatus Poriferisocius sp.]|uniref:GmrSD restriction endonuclease domain-containing protein n=1 Tax=Candidatus Poriferisocius sp. TaxID=3101276 RepID=UPI003B020FF1